MFARHDDRRDNAAAGRVIETDRYCRMCHYNLRGLAYGGACPECGAAIVRRNERSDGLSDVPMRTLKRMRLGMRLSLLSHLALLTMPFVLRPLARGEPPEWWPVPLAGAFLWSIAWWLIAGPIDTELGVLNGFGPRSKLRQAARLLLWAWPVLALVLAGWTLAGAPAPPPGATGAAVPALAPSPPPPAEPPTWIVAPLLVAGCAAIIVAGVLLQRLARWLYDLATMTTLTWTTAGLALASVGLLARPHVPLGSTLGVISAFTWVVSLLVLYRCVAELVADIEWSAMHAVDDVERAKRQRERRRRQAAERRRAEEAARAAESG